MSLIDNKRALFDYHILETIGAFVLQGSLLLIDDEYST